MREVGGCCELQQTWAALSPWPSICSSQASFWAGSAHCLWCCISNILGFPLKLRLYPHEVWVQPCRASLLCFSTPFQIPPVNWFQRHHEHSRQNLGPQPLCWPDFHRSDTHKRGRVSGRGDFIWLAASETSVRGLLSPSGWERSEVERGKQQR